MNNYLFGLIYCTNNREAATIITYERGIGSVGTTTRTGSTGIANAIREDIKARNFVHNDRLPPERALAERFDAARGTIREALKRLEESGWVVRRAGSGTYVTHVDPVEVDSIIEATSPIEMIDTRRALEPEIGRHAAVKATKLDIQRLEEILTAFEQGPTDQKIFSALDEKFHTTLVDCAKNALMSWIYKQVNEVRAHDQWSVVKAKTLNTKTIAMYHAQHRQIVEAIKSRDPEKTAELITTHLRTARATLVGDGLDMRGREFT